MLSYVVFSYLNGFKFWRHFNLDTVRLHHFWLAVYSGQVFSAPACISCSYCPCLSCIGFFVSVSVISVIMLSCESYVFVITLLLELQENRGKNPQNCSSFLRKIGQITLKLRRSIFVVINCLRRHCAILLLGECTSVNLSINQSCIFTVVQVIKSLQDPLEVGNNLPGISDNFRNVFKRWWKVWQKRGRYHVVQQGVPDIPVKVVCNTYVPLSLFAIKMPQKEKKCQNAKISDQKLSQSKTKSQRWILPLFSRAKFSSEKLHSAGFVIVIFLLP